MFFSVNLSTPQVYPPLISVILNLMNKIKPIFVVMLFLGLFFVAQSAIAQENPAFRQIASILFQISELIQDIAEEVKEIIKSEPTITPTPAPAPPVVAPVPPPPAPVIQPATTPASAPTQSPATRTVTVEPRVIEEIQNIQTQTLKSQIDYLKKQISSLQRQTNLRFINPNLQPSQFGLPITAAPVIATPIPIPKTTYFAYRAYSTGFRKIKSASWDTLSSPNIQTVESLTFPPFYMDSPQAVLDFQNNLHVAYLRNTGPGSSVEIRYRKGNLNEGIPWTAPQPPVILNIGVDANNIPYVVTIHTPTFGYCTTTGPSYIYLHRRLPTGWVEQLVLTVNPPSMATSISSDVDNNSNVHIVYSKSPTGCSISNEMRELVFSPSAGVLSDTIINSGMPAGMSFGRIDLDPNGNSYVIFAHAISSTPGIWDLYFTSSLSAWIPQFIASSASIPAWTVSDFSATTGAILVPVTTFPNPTLLSSRLLLFVSNNNGLSWNQIPLITIPCNLTNPCAQLSEATISDLGSQANVNDIKIFYQEHFPSPSTNWVKVFWYDPTINNFNITTIDSSTTDGFGQLYIQEEK